MLIAVVALFEPSLTPSQSKQRDPTDSGISLEPPPPILEEFKDDLFDGYTDEQLYQYYLQSPNIITTEPEIVKILSRNLVAKPRAYNDDPKDEFLAIELAHKLGILTPRVHRLVQFTTEEANDNLIIMDRVHGLTLEQLWPTLSLWNTFRLAWQLRRYLRCMGSVTAQTTGGLHTGLCNSPWFMDINGPTAHASPSTLCDYMNWWLLKCAPLYLHPRPDLVIEPCTVHTFVHQDLAPRNMIVDGNGKLWIVDWGHAGFYPPYMEYAGLEALGLRMAWLSMPTWRAWWGRLKWSLFRWIAAGPMGPHKKGYAALRRVHDRSVRFSYEVTPYSRHIPSRHIPST
jgi:serine/threonine protein kinase